MFEILRIAQPGLRFHKRKLLAEFKAEIAAAQSEEERLILNGLRDAVMVNLRDQGFHTGPISRTQRQMIVPRWVAVEFGVIGHRVRATSIGRWCGRIFPSL